MNTVVCFIVGGKGISERSITFKCMSEIDQAGNKQILQRESLQCILMVSAASLNSTCSEVLNHFRHLKVTAFRISVTV